MQKYQIRMKLWADIYVQCTAAGGAQAFNAKEFANAAVKEFDERFQTI